MQGLPYVAPPMSAGGTPVPGISHVGGPAHPQGVIPNLTQYPTAPVTGYPPVGYQVPNPYAFPQQQSTGQPATYQGALPYAGAPVPGVTRMPGPATLGPTSTGAAPSAPGGVSGVSMAPISGVAPPVTTGGPHPLPSLPQMPLPQGFPNPFAVQQMGLTPNQAPQQLLPGSTATTGPQGYLPGLGYFGSPAPTAFPMLPGGHQTAAQPIQPQAPAAAQVSPFWLQLAWQLLQTPAVKTALGDHFTALVNGDDRARTLQVAANCLVGAEMQNAFGALTSGALDQSRFTEQFAQSLKTALPSAGLVRAF